MNRWRGASAVHLSVCGCMEEGVYLRIRHKEFPSLDGDLSGQLLTVLRLGWRFLIAGGHLRFEAPCAFWNTSIAIPFLSLKQQSIAPVSL